MKQLLLQTIIAFCCWGLVSGQHRVEFDNIEIEYSESGYLQLNWSVISPDPTQEYIFQLQSSKDNQFGNAKMLYEGPDYATFISGLKDGTFFYRVRVIDAVGKETSWSKIKTVEVKHHSLTLAFSLFGLGAFVFLTTVGIVIQGNRRANSNI